MYAAVTNPSKLRSEMGSFYDFFIMSDDQHAVFSLPYLDAFGTGKMIFKYLKIY